MAASDACSGAAAGERDRARRPSVPVIANFAPSMPKAEDERLAGIADRLRAGEPALSATGFFGAQVEAGLAPGGPAVLIGDNREIALASARGAQTYEYRISHLAGAGDTLLISGGRSAAFERYRERVLGLGAIDVITLGSRDPDDGTPLAARCAADARCLERIADHARRAGGLSLLPHIGRGSAWVLAGALAQKSGVPVRVAAPPPRLTRRVNDKVWFAHRVEEVLGARARPSFHAVFGPAALAARALRLARRSERIVVKVPDSAGSAGNVALSAASIRDTPHGALRSHLTSVLNEVGWSARYPLLVEIWDSPVLASPSVQIWVPDLGEGPPVVEGVFEQIVAGARGEFVGSVPASLPERWEGAIVDEAFRLARLFQHLGYFGRCSFDAVLGGPDHANAALHWVECNGRWGGVSLPMTLANRLAGDWSRHPFVVVQRGHLRFAPRPFSEAVDLLGPDLYRMGESSQGVVLLSPLGIERGRSINLMAIAATTDRARALAAEATARLTGQAM